MVVFKYNVFTRKYATQIRCSPISPKSFYENTGLWREETANPASWNSLMNSGKNLKPAAVPRNKPKACSSSAMIYHQPYQLLLSSSCQLGQSNGWLKCMCGHPRVKWRLWLRQKMDSCGRAYGLIQRNVIDMFLCLLFLPLLLSTLQLLCQTQPFDKCPAQRQHRETWYDLCVCVCAVVWKHVSFFFNSFSCIFLEELLLFLWLRKSQNN